MNHVEELILVADKIDNVDKKASLLNPGDKVVCVNPVQGIFKGRLYLIDDYIEPNIVLISELTGEKIGAFIANRFCLDQKEY
jgi:hypothetical protein